MRNFKGKNVLITGGGSGIGKIMTRMMLEREANVIIWDISTENMESTVQDFSKLGKVHTYQVDVADIDQIKKAASAVKNDIGTIDVLINNAGIVVGKYFNEHTPQDITKTMDINANGPMLITLEFLEDMMKQNEGHICNIASSAGLVSNPKMSVYAASKWSVVGWSDSMRIEMEQLNKNVKVTTIMPYYIDTGMFDGVKSKFFPILDPEAAARSIIYAIKKDKKMVTLPGYTYRITRFAQAVMPIGLFDWLMGEKLGIYDTMKDFTGRKK